MEAMYTDAEYNLEAGLLIPKNNIATQPKSATVIEGVCRSRFYCCCFFAVGLP